MKKIMIVILFITAVAYGFSQNKSSGVQFNGSLETTAGFYQTKIYSADPSRYSDYTEFNWGLKNLANLRLKAVIGDYLSFGLAINVRTLAGSETDMYKADYNQQAVSSGLAYQFVPTGTMGLLTTGKVVAPYGALQKDSYFSIPFYSQNTYIGSFELERLYFKAGNSYFDIQTGLIRLARGYGYMFSPNDLFNPRNPLDPSERPAGNLTVQASFYPLEMWTIDTFMILPDNPLEKKGWGFKFGTSTNFFIKKYNFEFLYALCLPEVEYLIDPKELGLPENAAVANDFTHIAGFSMKLDIEIGLFADIIYQFEQKSFRTGDYYGKPFFGYEGLQAAFGMDYTVSYSGGNIYFCLEYLFFGSGMVDWGSQLDELYTGDWQDKSPFSRAVILNPEKKHENFARHDYLFGLIRVKLNDYVTIGNSYLFGADDQSALLTGFVDIEPFQSFSINCTALIPLDWKMLNSGNHPGEFGATNLGFYQNWKVTVKVRF